MKKFICTVISLVLIIASLVLATSCNPPLYSPKKVMLILHAWSSELASEVTKGANSASKQYNTTLFTKAVSKDNNRGMQAELIDKAINDGYDAIIIEPLNYGEIWAKIEEAKKHGLNVVLINNFDEEKDYDYVNIDMQKLKNLLIDEIKQRENPKVLILNCIDTYENTTQIKEIIVDALTKNNISFDSLDFSTTKMTDTINSLEYTSKEFNVVVALNEFSSLIASNEIKNGNYKLIAFSKTLKVIDKLEKGSIDTVCALDYYSLGYIALENIIKNDYSNNYIAPYSVNINNLYSYNNQRLLFPL